jgi:Protein of Unknown function (DUF2784)
MGTFALQLVNILFLIFHTLLIVFNCFGWVWRRTRKWNLVTLMATAFSWLVMGLKYGIGYCVCTDWHFQVRRALGYHDPEGSYIDFLFRVVSGWSPDPALTRIVAGWVFGISVALSVGLGSSKERIACCQGELA